MKREKVGNDKGKVGKRQHIHHNRNLFRYHNKACWKIPSGKFWRERWNMATIVLEKDGSKIQDPEKVREFLKSKGLEYRHWTTKPELDTLLDKEALEDSEKEKLLEGLDNRFQELKDEYGYATRDLIVLHPQVPGLSDMLAKFDKMHYHTDDEVRYIVDGSGVFGFHIGDEKFSVHVERNDFISVPKNTHHWFKLDEKMRIKAVRYFIDTSGWTPHYV